MAAAAMLCLAAAQNASRTAIDFNRQVRPILSDNCFACHGPDAKNRMAELRLDEKDSAARVIVAGKRNESKLFQRLNHANPALRMPPKALGRTLTPEQIETVGRWIDQGAEWKMHWSYEPPRRPPVPNVAGSRWPRNPIDNFVLARLQKEGLKPSAEASKSTLLRRLTLDLTGLPPTPEETRAFLADKSPDAYEKAVDRLLASPHYGERMAMQWLDLARYADTHGYHIDSHRDMWPWRDWVIQAFSSNMPFDRFTVDQLAGDLLPNATKQQLLATGFNRNHMINYEGGAIPEEYLVEYIVDRVETTAVAFMGMTIGCARCHDHKYDPISQRDFYRYFAFFNNIDEKGLDGREGNAKPLLALPDDAQKARLAELEQAVAARETLLPAKNVDAAMEEWSKSAELSMGPRDAAAHYELDGGYADTSGNYRHARLIRGTPSFSNGPSGLAIGFDGETQMDWGAYPAGEAFSASFWLRWGNKLEQAFLHRFDKAALRGVIVRMEEAASIGDLKRASRIEARLANRWPENAIEVRTENRVAQNEYTHIAVTYDGSGKASGVKIFFNGVPQTVAVLKDKLSGSIIPAAPWSSGDGNIDLPSRAQLDDLRFFARPIKADEARQLAVDATVRAILSTPAAKRSKDQKDRLKEYFLSTVAPPEWRKAHAEGKELRAAMDALNRNIVTSMVMTELPKPRETFVLGRGDYRNRTEKVTPAVPASLPPLPAGAPANRLGLAKWLVDPSHPLTARVAVNRFWQMYFGSGLVETSEDFGSQGAPPTHPELLDWLATHFVESGWDVRAMQRLLVTSATYRQTSQSSPEMVERDPRNRLLARMSRFRLPAETVRDNALAIGGLLNRTVGGKSVFPYQPGGLWEEMAYGDVFTAQTYVQSHGDDLYRRSMYTFWKRTVPPAQMSVFDAPDREKCAARRARTNTPLQALVLMNDPTYLEAARALAEKVMVTAGRDANSRIRLAFQMAAARAPDARELKLLSQLAVRQQQAYRSHPETARKLITAGERKPAAALDPSELAAWTTVTSAILNLDEVITKE
ncbi:MAG: DUF1553 domain-containing protein [Candidatus Solibacter usitatus]|nr:DUF1553 domain-containing protein [Candidatus Solibacter usitatus]